eukprot:scaffold16561_cov117-Cyclotella_meneghiniana.AAC.4
MEHADRCSYIWLGQGHGRLTNPTICKWQREASEELCQDELHTNYGNKLKRKVDDSNKNTAKSIRQRNEQMRLNMSISQSRNPESTPARILSLLQATEDQQTSKRQNSEAAFELYIEAIFKACKYWYQNLNEEEDKRNKEYPFNEIPPPRTFTPEYNQRIVQIASTIKRRKARYLAALLAKLHGRQDHDPKDKEGMRQQQYHSMDDLIYLLESGENWDFHLSHKLIEQLYKNKSLFHSVAIQKALVERMAHFLHSKTADADRFIGTSMQKPIKLYSSIFRLYRGMCMEAREVHSLTTRTNVLDQFIGVGIHNKKDRSNINRMVFKKVVLDELLTPTAEQKRNMPWLSKFVTKEPECGFPFLIGLALNKNGCDELCTYVHNQIMQHPKQQSLINAFGEIAGSRNNVHSHIKALKKPTCDKDRTRCTKFLRAVLEEVTGLKCTENKGTLTLNVSPHHVAMCFNLNDSEKNKSARCSVDLFLLKNDLTAAERFLIETGIEIFNDVRRSTIEEHSRDAEAKGDPEPPITYYPAEYSSRASPLSNNVMYQVLQQASRRTSGASRNDRDNPFHIDSDTTDEVNSLLQTEFMTDFRNSTIRLHKRRLGSGGGYVEISRALARMDERMDDANNTRHHSLNTRHNSQSDDIDELQSDSESDCEQHSKKESGMRNPYIHYEAGDDEEDEDSDSDEDEDVDEDEDEDRPLKKNKTHNLEDSFFDED